MGNNRSLAIKHFNRSRSCTISAYAWSVITVGDTTLSDDAGHNPATIDETKLMLEKLRNVDVDLMMDHANCMPAQILAALQSSVQFDEGDLPLDHSHCHLVGLGGSAIAGELLRDMIAPRRVIAVHRGTLPPRDKCGVIVSSYSGNTDEILELAPKVIGGLKSVVIITSGGKLKRYAEDYSIPLWKVPPGYQARAAVGWSMALLVSILERWRVIHGVKQNLINAAHRLQMDLQNTNSEDHHIVRAAVPIAKAMADKNVLIFHTLKCQGAARRFGAQIAENGKQASFTVVMPEALHNVVEGIAGTNPDRWLLIFMSDPDDQTSLKAAISNVTQHFSKLGFNCLPFPVTGDNQYELTLSRVLLADFSTLFLAAINGINPTPVTTISALKEPPSSSPETPTDNLEQ